MAVVGQYGAEVQLSASSAVLPLTAVTVLRSDLSTATLYTNLSGVTTGPNPVFTDAIGNLIFYAAPGQYFLQLGSNPPYAEVSVGPLPHAASHAGTGTDPVLASVTTNLAKAAKKDGSLTGDGVTDDSAAFVAFMTALAGLQPALVTVYWEPGIYNLTPTAMLSVPWNVVGFEPVHAHAATLFNLGNTVGTFIAPRSSRFTMHGMVVDANRDAQTAYWTAHAGSIDSYVALNFQRGNSTAGTGGGALTLAGGMTLAVTLAATSTTMLLTLPYSGPSGTKEMVLPGDVITVTDGTNYERLRVAPTFVVGNTSGTGGSCSVPLEYPVINSYPTSVWLVHCLTDVSVSDNIFYGAGVQGAAMDGGSIDHNKLLHQIDTSLGHFERGNRGVRWERNLVETYSYWGVVIDEFGTSLASGYAPNEEIIVAGNEITFLPGGPDLNESPPIGAGNLDCIFVSANRCGVVDGNILNMVRSPASPPTGHISGVRLQNHLTSGTSNLKGISVTGNTIRGNLQTGSYGVLVSNNNAATDPDIDALISHNSIENCLVGIDLGALRHAQVNNNRVRGGNWAVNQVNNVLTGSPSLLHSINGNVFDGAAVGIRFVATLPCAANSGYVGSNIITNASFAQVSLDTNFTHNPTGQAN